MRGGRRDGAVGPARGGVLLDCQGIGNGWLAIACALVIRTAVTRAVTAWTLRVLQRSGR